MKFRVKIFFTSMLTITYALASIVGHLIIFHELLNCVSTSKQYNKKSSTHNASTVPIWTQKKHFPASQKDEVTFFLWSKNNSTVPVFHFLGILSPQEIKFDQSVYSYSSRPRSPPSHSRS